jgi:Glycosyl transferase family 2
VGGARTPILYLAPWVDLGDPERSTIEWFEQIDHERWAPSLIATQPSPNRRLREIEPLAEEAWDLPDLMPGGAFPEFILGFIESRGVRLVHVMGSRLAFDLLPDMACLPRPPAVVVQLGAGAAERPDYVRYATRHYGNLIDAFSVADEQLKEAVRGYEIPPSRIEAIPPGPEMGRRHDELYERLLGTRPASSLWRGEELFGAGAGRSSANDEGASTEPLSLPRDPAPSGTVGVIVPCFRHGIFLDECIDSIKAQTLPPARIVIVDDGSDDPETIAALERLDADPDLTVLRQPVNAGPSAARNRGLEQLETSYVLSLDADDRLLPDALERMLAQLQAAPADVGFVYPHAQHFGNRSDYVQLPAYNLWLLMQENYCPAPALFDRRLFAGTGVSYPEDIVLGHEDWDLILQLAERGIRGIHADGPTFLYRRQGFSRVNAVDYGPHAFHEAIEHRHPSLYDHRESIKACWAPALSVVLLGGEGAWGDDDLAGLSRQSCIDFEILAGTEIVAGARAVGAEPSAGREWLQAAIDEARGRWICLLEPGAAGSLRDDSFVEKLLHAFVAHERTAAIVLAEHSEATGHAFAQLDDAERLSATPLGVVIERPPSLPMSRVEIRNAASTLADLATAMQVNGPVQWRTVPAGEGAEPVRDAGPDEGGGRLSLTYDRSGDSSVTAMRDSVANQAPLLPELTPGTVRRWKSSEAWLPPGTQPLCRHLELDGDRRIVSNDPEPPYGYALEFELGALLEHAAPGTRRLVQSGQDFELSDEQNALGKHRHAYGYVEQEPLPLLERLELRIAPETGQPVLVAGPDDPLFDLAEPVGGLGWIEARPILPRHDPPHAGPWGVDTLWSRFDRAARRHRYGTDPPSDAAATALGSLLRHPEEDLVALRQREDGRLVSDLAQPGRASRDPRKIGRWVTAPLTKAGREAAGEGPRGAAARLGRLALHPGARRLATDDGVVLGWLRMTDSPGCSPLVSATHPVTGDQLATCSAREALDRGYTLDGVLGYVLNAGTEPAR